MSKRYLMLVGDPNDINTWSNTPYYFLQAGLKTGFFSGGLPLQPRKLKILRSLWNLRQLLRTGKSGGFQYSDIFARRLLQQAQFPDEPLELISHFPLLPFQSWPSQWKLSYYIDATTKQVFSDYNLGARLAESFQQQVLDREKQNFQQADHIICMCQWAADSVAKDYDIDLSKVFVIPGGANLDESILQQLPPSETPPLQPLRLGFIGKDWQRKGLPLLLKVAEELQQQGWQIEVPVIGPPVQSLPTHPLLKPLGFLNKNHQLPQFVETVRSFHFGCLFSNAEASPRSNLECLRLGVPVLSLNVGGIPDTVPESLGHLFEPDVSASEIANTVEIYLNSPDQYMDLRQQVLSRSDEFTWARAVEAIESIFHENT